MNILGQKVMLRAIEEEDLDLLHKWANNPEICYMLGGWHFPGSKAITLKWFENIRTDPLNQRYAIEVPDVGLIGTANLVGIDWKNRNAFHGMMLGDKNIRGKGYGIDTIMAIMRYSFEELNLNRLDGTIIEYNTISYKVYCDKCGWKEEGRRKDWYFRKNKNWDQILVGILRRDYQELISTTHYWD